MRGRYPDQSNPGSAKVPSILYYDHDGNFCGVENGGDSQDNEAFLRIRWLETVIFLCVQDSNGALGGG